MHGLRHGYALRRLRGSDGLEGTGGGRPRAVRLEGNRSGADHKARLTISRELGRGRASIVAQYVG